MSSAQAAFGHRLREARERRGLSIDAIAASTKINGALFAELERGDIKRWPSAIFRRAFFREYAGAIGLDPEPLLPDFLRLFPEEPSIQVDTVVRPEALRMTLAPGPSWTVATASRRLGSALAELAIVAAAGTAIAASGNANLWTGVGIAAMGYWTVSTAILGRGAVAWWVERQADRATSRPAAAHQLRIVISKAPGTSIGAGVDADVPGLRAASR